LAVAGSILAVGGAEDKFDKRVILSRFVAEAGGPAARIAILPTASTIPDRRSAFYQQVFAGLGAEGSFGVPITDRQQAEDPSHAETLRSATGIFMTGGDQSRLVSVLSTTPAFDAVRERLRRGCVLAGTSAAASAFSATMITGGGTGLRVRPDTVELGRGFGVLPDLIIDQHFSQRDRLGRLLSAVGQEPARLGVGIDEDTAIVVSAREIEVLGSGQVFFLDASHVAANGIEHRAGRRLFTLSEISMHVLVAGDRFDRRARRLVN
jgi:cyanophycinase